MANPDQAGPEQAGEEEAAGVALLCEPDDLHAYIPYLLNWLTNRWNLDQNRELSEHGINATILRALSALYIFKRLTVNEIAAYAMAEQSNASRTIDSMVSAGLVERHISESDLRRRDIMLTGKGEALLKRLWPAMVRNHRRMVADIPKKDIDICIATLKAMMRNLSGA
ncbi:MarR family winged helix-turn-helix transcriptional regulator [Brucella anthropi]|uniref:MarR family winged helix-turn-helix transcriptional regulator n=1 Tax=Brucella anthropi TaxID=529 RepID=UPI0039870D99